MELAEIVNVVLPAPRPAAMRCAKGMAKKVAAPRDSPANDPPPTRLKSKEYKEGNAHTRDVACARAHLAKGQECQRKTHNQ